MSDNAKPDFPWTVRVEEDWGHDRLGDCLVCVPCDGFVHDNTYQLVTGEIVAINVTPKGIRINRRDREPEYVALEETPDLIMGMVVHTMSVSAQWHRKVWTGG